MQKTVCDICGKDIEEQDKETIQYSVGHKTSNYKKFALRVSVKIYSEGSWIDADVCTNCLCDIYAQRDKRPKPSLPSVNIGV